MPSHHRRALLPLVAVASLVLFALVIHAAARAATSHAASSVTLAVSPVPRIHAHVLRPGSSGVDVTRLQQLLTRVGVHADVTGHYRYTTARAVQRFQLAAVLKTSGIAGPKTIARLLSSARGPLVAANAGGVGFGAQTVSTARLGDRIPLAAGMSGRDVRQLQDFLGRAGVANVPRPSGEFDAHTAAAVRRYEKRIGHDADGVVDAGDIYRLVRAVGGDARPGDNGDPQGVELGALPLSPGDKATLGADGLAVAPEAAPLAIRQIIAAGNRIAKKPYVYGGGHGSWIASAYDCSASVSYALRGAGLLTRPLASYDYFGWGKSGPGSWVTIYTNSGHMFMVVAGLRFDTSGRSAGGSRWQRDVRGTSAYRVRHPAGL